MRVSVHIATMVNLNHLPISSVALGATVSLMANVITQRELRNNNADIMRRVEDGESFVITRNGKQVASLRPSRRSSTIDTAVLMNALTGIAGDSYTDLRRDLDEIANQESTPRG